MKKILAFALLIVTLLILVISSVNDLTRLFAQAKYKSKAWWGSDKYIYGDLYGFCYLPKFRINAPQGVDNRVKFDTTATETKKIDLYALSDSYTWEIFTDPSLFYHVNKITFTRLNDKQVTPITLDKTKKNILILESSERNIRLVYEDTAYLTRFFDFKPSLTVQNTAIKPTNNFRFNFKLNDVDANIEFNLWDYRLLTPFKEFKAQLSYSLFNRINPDAYVSDDKRYLLYGITVDTIYKQSSFKPIGKPELNGIIEALNKTYDYYKSKGFDEVYMAIIPNPVTILYPHYNNYTYNQLIPLVQNDKRLKVKVIDAGESFKQARTQIYCYSDTHWNYNGEKIWLSLVNNILKKY
ncbi:MAG: hypothetical protein JWQ06_2553 [Mucilaginibacter sp.]|nr:hypothetical protein [Mucilaginibacter sp.]